MKLRRVALLLSICFLLLGGSAGMASKPTKYQLLRKIVVGGEGSWDYAALDQSHRRLYVSHETEVAILDIDREEVVGRIPNLRGVHGIAPVPGLGKVFISEGKADSVAIFDTRTLSRLGEVKTGRVPDAVIYDPSTRRVFTSNGESADMTAIDAATGNVAGTIPVGGDPESTAVDGKGHVWVDLADKNEVVEVDSRKLTVKERWPIAGCTVPKSIAIDVKNRRLFVGCRNQVMAVVDAASGRVIEKLPIGDHVDATIFDPDTGMIFNSNGDGTVTVIHEDSANRFHVVETITTRRGAKTMALDLITKRLFLPVAESPPLMDNPTGQKQSGSPVLATFVVLVFGR